MESENRFFKFWPGIEKLNECVQFLIIVEHDSEKLAFYRRKFPEAFFEEKPRPEDSPPFSVIVEGYKSFVAELSVASESMTDVILQSIVGAFAEYGITAIQRTRQEVVFDGEFKGVFELNKGNFNLFEKNSGEIISYTPPNSEKKYLLLYKDDYQFIIVKTE